MSSRKIRFVTHSSNSEQNMVEIISGSRYTLEDFLIEFNNGNFVNGQRVKPYKQF